ncbi:short-chain dehydrogenase of various substrate specificities [Longilinea arvoryzae]|uniref:Short-chain dehydrogenase of various substrate specificities n=1 Tax=Longilinea arvoryzae TaxID=360412 RepID=A0A0S7BG63_9CHLR|nr:SDR family oxidoreductase [Longilinea arvoryzae]GAP13555.1 short-chain dehydrogenase of various substrate specificities [Longilinea arvoryzae]
MKLLEGKTAVITGSSRGLGFAIAKAFAEQGASIVLAARTADTLNSAVAELKNQGYQAEGFICDTARIEDVEGLAQRAVSTFGHLDIWVNNAGIGAPYGSTMSISPERIKKVVDTNIIGVYHGSYVAMRQFLAQGSGKLINLLGRGDSGPMPYQNAYASSKAWVKNFTQALAREYAGTGIEVMAFNPGLVITEMLTQVDAIVGFEKKVLPLNTVIRFWGNLPEVPARKVVWMASSATDRRNGLIVNFLSFGRLIAGVGKELWRWITHAPISTPIIKVRITKS